MKKFKRIYVEITNICNLNCRFCEPPNRPSQFMTLENIEHIFNEIKNYTNFVYLHVKGEPLLHPELSTILGLAQKYNLHVIITTNGTLLTKNADALSNAKNLRQINISLHSIEQNNLEDTFNNSIKTIAKDANQNTNDNFKSINNYLINIFNIVNNITLSNNCFISYRLWNLENIKDNSKNTEILKNISEYYNIPNLFELIKTNDFVKLDNTTYLNLDTIYEWPSLSKDIISTKGSCYGLIQQLAILADGTVVPCCLDQNGDINLGNIFKESLDNILSSKKCIEIVNGFKRQKLIEPLCQRCGFRENKRR